MRKLTADERGSVLLEFVVASMIILMVWAGMCNVALILKDRLTVAAAARESGRTAAVTKNAWEGSQRGYDVLTAGGIDRGRATVDVTIGVDIASSIVECRIPVAVPGLMMLFGGAPWGNEINVSGSAVFRKEPDY